MNEQDNQKPVYLLPENGPVITRIVVETLIDTLAMEIYPTSDYGRINQYLAYMLKKSAEEEKKEIEFGMFNPMSEAELQTHYDRIQAESKEDGKAAARWRELCRVKRSSLDANPASAQNAGQSEGAGLASTVGGGSLD